jgi:hypothetical protein
MPVKRYSKVLIVIAIGLVVISFVAYMFLFVDLHRYPSVSSDGLQSFSSDNIPKDQVKIIKDSTVKNISADGEWFVDATGRRMMVRGINLGGSSKMPFTPRMASHIRDNFFETASSVSFVGRPFPLSDADEHFARLAAWGFHFVRFLITWEAIEHEGPGIYDQAYIDYVYAIIKKAGEHHINVFIDPHQDVWSRFSGGDGAPLWTLDKAGIDPTKFSESGAAVVHNVYGDPFPKMVWPTNYSKLGAATMFTLFFGGRDFAPQTKVDSVNIQDYLQNHYINAVLQVAKRVRDLPNVIGFDTLNEPSTGYIGIANLDSLPLLRIGPIPTFFQGMSLGDGNADTVSTWKFDLGFKETGREVLNKNRVKVWKENTHDIWQRYGVWGYSEKHQPVLFKKDYFSTVNGKHVDFSDDYWKPFALKFIKAIHNIDERWLIFAEPAVFTKLPTFSAFEADKFVNAGHWYDGVTLIMKKNMGVINANVETQATIFGKRAIREYFQYHLGKLKSETNEAIGQHPTLIGEFGIPFDMNEGGSFSSGDFSDQEDAIDRSFNAMESNLLNYTLWNYTNDNDNAHGDQWNGEDLSVFSLSQLGEIKNENAGGRALNAVIRPYPYKVPGRPQQTFFNKDNGEFFLSFEVDLSIHEPAEIFLPAYHYANGFNVFVSEGNIAYDPDKHLLLYYPKGEGVKKIIVRKTTK